MKVVNRSSRPQAWKEVILQPGDVWQDGVVTKLPDEKPKRGRPRKGQ